MTGAVKHHLRGWTPTEFRLDRGQPAIRWRYTEGVDFSEPFFDDTIRRCLKDPFRLLFWRQTGIESLAEFADSSPGLAPAGFIFHMSRCGSTLVTQALGRCTSVLCLSEPGPLDSVLRAGSSSRSVPDGQRREWAQLVMSALGQPRREDQTRFVVKLDAWATVHLPLIMEAFPATPAIFVYRDPVEVMVSHLGRRGFHTVPGTLPPEWFGLAQTELGSITPEQYIARVLAQLCADVVPFARSGQVRLMEYRSLPTAVYEDIAPLFAISVSEQERQAMAERVRWNAKNPAVTFESDAEPKQRSATAQVRAAATEVVGPYYQALEGLR